VADTQYLVTFGVMMLVAVVISTLTARIKGQAESSKQRERRTHALYSLSRELASARNLDTMMSAVQRHIAGVFEVQSEILLASERGGL
jgi:two-component system sensor histidine kinase KdpD